ncbi:hypothetical protein [Kribbella sp. CA-293567]|uniref:hypothetical protein n=1 Tax=Kribbella sp. CA-293567 TaxID=3002436 RepID=UPI0022DE7908|nr:hypothetical protein [Kribbella sp. CA-293567]WBQ02939.1 hypothetical protein OX958_23500 [Kribbella sp. CA-293567]
MSLTATYDAALSRVRLSGTLLGATATYARFERSADAGITWVTVRGGSTVTVASQNARVDDYEWTPGVLTTYRVTSYDVTDVQQAQFTTTITQDLPGVWLKVPAAPYLNRAVTVSTRTEIGRRSRGGVFDVVGRTFPVLVGDVRSGREFGLRIRTESPSDERDLDYLFASGEVLYLQAPAAMDQFPIGYYAAGDVKWTLPTERERRTFPQRRYWDVPLTEVAAPGPAVVGSTYTCASVLADYATVTALLAANATIADLLERVASPSDVIVG